MPKLKIKIEDLFNIPSAVIYNPDEYQSTAYATIDSRNVKKGAIFFALKGKNFDGHKFVKDALEKGAGAIVINENRLDEYDFVKGTIVTVKDTTKSYGDLAKIVRLKSKYLVVSLTGSAGKTTTKEMIATLLSERFAVSKTEANNNNHIGVPLSIFFAEPKTDILILEHGTNHFGEIEYSANIAMPDYALITNIGEAHIQYLKNKESVYEEKAKLFEAAQSKGGKIFVNSDDPVIRKGAAKFKSKTTFGFKGKPDVKGEIIDYDSSGFPKIKIANGKRNVEVKLPLLGEASAKNFLAAVSVAFEFGLTKKEIISGAKKLKSVAGRLDYEIAGKSMIINDAYNSSPESVKAALETLKKNKKLKRKIILLGDMLELGRKAPELHAELASYFKGLKSSEILLIGKNMLRLSEKLKDKKFNVKHFRRRDSLKKYLEGINLTETAVLVKGSRGMKMEEFLRTIKETAA
ncbi:MAG: UDP-N-acetylmuramoyl-tripeptide--D-alanyl-D-alanine ligase [Chlorobi bacterium]|nr:UDP-N-acetylmuramoyl-tripeptide--D-alanyl-D-alanine ligase [Chlorobiota bacterium]